MQQPDTPALDTSFHDAEMNVGPDDWERWLADIEKTVGHDLDGDQDWDGYSYDVLADWHQKKWPRGVVLAKLAINKERVATVNGKLNRDGLKLGHILTAIAPSPMWKTERGRVLRFLERWVKWYDSRHDSVPLLVREPRLDTAEDIRANRERVGATQVQDIAELKYEQWADPDSIKAFLYGPWGIRIILHSDEQDETVKLTVELIDKDRRVTNTYRFVAKDTRAQG